MPNIASVLKQEISRLARKEARAQTSVLKKLSAMYRRDIAGLKRIAKTVQRKLAIIEKQAFRGGAAPVADRDLEKTRFSPKGLISHRKKVGLSAAEYGKLLGVTAQAVYNWERRVARPRKEQWARLLALRQLGKREVAARLAVLSGGKK
jgi:DNA-binding transcriptional regulator YiaG